MDRTDDPNWLEIFHTMESHAQYINGEEWPGATDGSLLGDGPGISLQVLGDCIAHGLSILDFIYLFFWCCLPLYYNCCCYFYFNFFYFISIIKLFLTYNLYILSDSTPHPIRERVCGEQLWCLAGGYTMTDNQM